MKRFGKGLFVFLFIFWVFSATANAAIVDRIVAVVNNEAITLSDLNEELDAVRQRMTVAYRGEELEKLIAEARPTLLNRMVDRLLIGQEARKSGIVIKDEEINDTIRDVLAQRKLRMEELVATLSKEGTTLEQYKREIRDHLIKMKLIRREIHSKIMITNEEIGAYYQKNRDEYEGKEAVRIRQILLPVPPGADEGAKRAILQDAEAILQRLRAGEVFEMLAARYSKGPGAAAGGDVGYVERGMILPEVEEIAFSLKVREASGVISSPVGFHIIQVIDKRGAGLKPIETVREEIRRKLEDEKSNRKYDEWIGELRKKSHIEIR